jgi:hypothetical protein
MKFTQRDVEIYMYLANLVRRDPDSNNIVSPTTVTDDQARHILPPNASEVDTLYRKLLSESGVGYNSIFN